MSKVAARGEGDVGGGGLGCKGDCESSKGKMARANKGTRARARVD